MAGTDKSTQRVIAVIALLILAALALRGYVPGAERSDEREPSPDNPAALFAVVALLCAAVAIIGFAIITRLRDRRPRRPAAGALPRGSGAMGRPTWRFSVIALAVIIAWIALVTLLLQTGEQGPSEPPASEPPAATEPDTPAQRRETADPPPPPVEPESGTDIVGYLIPPMLLLMVLVVIGTAVASVRQRRRTSTYSGVAPVEHSPAGPAAADSLARAAEVGLAEIGDLSREPREAIIACYAAMENELTRVPGAAPQDCDTPTEVLARAVASHALQADSATKLVELFEEARFSPHVMTETHRDVAVRVLERVLTELPQRSAT